MKHTNGLDRRAFLRSAGLTALAGAVPVGAAAATPIFTAGDEPANGRYDFDTVFDRIGTDCTKWDQQIKTYGRDHFDVGMGIADMDFKHAPCITRALMERVQRDNGGYLSMPDSYYESIIAWNKRRYGLEIDRRWIVNSPAVHPAIIATLRAFSPPGTKVLVPAPAYS